jgi:hypothetical protein
MKSASGKELGPPPQHLAPSMKPPLHNSPFTIHHSARLPLTPATALMSLALRGRKVYTGVIYTVVIARRSRTLQRTRRAT